MKNFLRTTFLLMSVLLFSVSANAIPAKRVWQQIKQSDGSVITVMMIGDEWNHSLVTSDGLTVQRDSNGDVYYTVSGKRSSVLVHDADDRDASEIVFVQAQKSKMTLASKEVNNASRAKVRAKANAIRKATQVPTTGTPNVPIILVQYTDKKMSNTMATFESTYTEVGGVSAYQYFVDQSNGKYKPNFVLFGIYTLSSSRATYGANDANDYDKGLGKMVTEAINLADADGADFSIFDNDGDGEVDVVVVVYAGVGEAQATSITNSVWPCQWSLSDAHSYNSSDGNGSFTVDGVTVDKFAVFNEVNGSSDSSTKIDGIGTFCHEFSHCLGLPDFYETTYNNGYYGMGSWSLMDYGSYNNDGYTPIGYSAYEKNFMGWIDLIDPTENTYYTLPILNQKSEDTDKAVKIVSDLNSNEYYIIENRAQQGWDKYIPDEGLLVHHYTYVASRWEENSVNDKALQLATIVPADNKLTSATEAYDCFPYNSNDSLTDNSSPATTLNMKSSGSLASSTGGAGSLSKPVTEMVINSDGSASFWYIKAASQLETYAPVLTATAASDGSIAASWTDETPAENLSTYTLYINKVQDNCADKSLLLSETFSGVDATKSSDGSTDISGSLDTYSDNAGWTGSAVYTAMYGGLKLGASKKQGYITSPSLDLSATGGTITVKFNAKYYNNDNSSVVVSCGSASQTVSLSNEATDYTVVLSGVTASSGQTIKLSATANKKRFYLYNVYIYSGDVSGSNAPRREVSEEGDSSSRTVSGITETNYTVDGLEPGNYVVSVVAHYTDESTRTSNIDSVSIGIHVAISSCGYATLYYGNYDLQIPEGVTASIVTAADDNVATLEAIETVIPAGEPVVISGAEGTYTFYIASCVDVEKSTSNLLRGSDEEQTYNNADSVYYMLSEKDGDNIGFYYQTDDGASITNAAHHAYLPLQKDSADAKGYIINGTPTGIDAISTDDNASATIYTISGIRLNPATNRLPKGVYIINGKKVVIR